ncbi:hypothetical protein B0H19DRAFT_431589 [Mycena capillaripes]|nr:hypothetical protein B0H19DRAFT_431589 [Mycena capillaripes]
MQNSTYTSTMFMAMIEAEAIIVSLVFEHSLCIRVKDETPNLTPSYTPSVGGQVESESEPSAASKKAPVPPDSSNLIGMINNLIAADANNAANKGKDVLRVVLYAPGSPLLGTYFLVCSPFSPSFPRALSVHVTGRAGAPSSGCDSWSCSRRSQG